MGMTFENPIADSRSSQRTRPSRYSASATVRSDVRRAGADQKVAGVDLRLTESSAQGIGERARVWRALPPGGREQRRRERDRRRLRLRVRCRPGAGEPLTPNPFHHLFDPAPHERMLASHHLVQHHAQGPDVVRLLGQSAGEHLRR